MRLTPRYDGPPVLRFTGPVGDPSVPLLRQRRRLGELVAGLDDTEWAAESRCAGWTVRDVIAHLVGVDQFWVLSITSALAGEPTRYLDGFDPVAVPATMVDGTRDQPAAAVLDGFLQGIDALAAAVDGLDEAQWALPAEAPPGHVSLHALSLHALWDAWIHERDILLPLGRTQVEEPDEVRDCVRYAAGLGPALLATTGSTRSGALVVDGRGPDVCVVVEAGETVTVGGGPAPGGAVRLEGRTIDLLEALSIRGPFPHPIAEQDRWMFGGLATAFDAAPDSVGA
jgi:uncharacterized protein (TIGR03083 family)